MNRTQFLTLLRKELGSMPIKEQNELLEDYESHYAFGQQEGKTEEQISVELGDPIELAVEATAEYHRNFPAKVKVSTTVSNTTFSIVGLFLLNFVLAVVPLGIAIWATWLSLLVASIMLIVAPLIVSADFIINQYFSMGKLFACITLSGIGIFISFGVLYIGKELNKITVSYYNWNKRVITGGQ
ncbi:MAG: DUF1700 domain-containing protein [Candidatus Cohnella colombiensis]|uniref:DUF1700 domain-containing protein n=1 Tax=Candidatus Cohnella colombiensis TaxID=3121368 RepID=A0AA95EV94_9BACL|nr:MAG: DUF1700 domain-containing protein [Cohnella sp.]